MKAILIEKDTNALSWSDVPNPVVGPEDALVEIHAAALNRADLMQRAGDYPPPPGCPEWMGLEIAGVIVELGEEAKKKSSWKIFRRNFHPRRLRNRSGNCRKLWEPSVLLNTGAS